MAWPRDIAWSRTSAWAAIASNSQNAWAANSRASTRSSPAYRVSNFLAMPFASPALDHGGVCCAPISIARAAGYPVLEMGLTLGRTQRADPGRDRAGPIRIIASGNYMVDEAGLTAILDWESSGPGAIHGRYRLVLRQCWRYGEDSLEAGGIAPRADFYRRLRSGRRLGASTPRRCIIGKRWPICAGPSSRFKQADRHISGQERSLELALTGPRVGGSGTCRDRSDRPRPLAETGAAGRPRRTVAARGIGLACEARRVAIEELLPLAARGAARYEARMIATCMAIAGRELTALRPSAPEWKSLAAAIRAGKHDADATLRDRLAADVLARLAVSNPRALPNS